MIRGESVENDPQSLSVCIADEEFSNEKYTKAQDWRMPLAAILMTFVFPPLGCVAFCVGLRYPDSSAKHKWGRRSMYVGGALSLLYVFIIASLIAAYQKASGVILGLSF